MTQGCLPFSEQTKPQNSTQRKCLVWVSQGLPARVSSPHSLLVPGRNADILRIQPISPWGEVKGPTLPQGLGCSGSLAKPQGDTGKAAGKCRGRTLQSLSRSIPTEPGMLGSLQRKHAPGLGPHPGRWGWAAGRSTAGGEAGLVSAPSRRAGARGSALTCCWFSRCEWSRAWIHSRVSWNACLWETSAG